MSENAWTGTEQGRGHLAVLASDVHANSHAKGFYFEDESIAFVLRSHGQNDLADFHRLNVVAKKIALIGSEASEALEETRADGLEGAREKFIEELADVVIRALDLAEWVAPGEIAEAVYNKHAFNTTRPVKHGKEF